MTSEETRTAITLQEVGPFLQKAYEGMLEKTWVHWPSSTPRASNIGHPCTVKQALEIVRPGESKEPDIERRGNFWTGHCTEWDVLAGLEDFLTGSTTAKITSRQESLALRDQIPGTELTVVSLSGHLDARLEISNLVDDHGDLCDVALPLEVKAIRSELWERIENGSVDSLLAHYSWAKSWISQVQAYALMTEAPAGILLVLSKQHRLPMVFLVPADPARHAEIQKRAMDVLLATQLPLERLLEKARYLHDECPGCPFFRGLCTVRGVAPTVDILQPEVQARVLELYEAKDAIASERTKLVAADKKLGDELKSILTARDADGVATGVERAELPDGSLLIGRRVVVGPKEGYDFWRLDRKKGDRAGRRLPSASVKLDEPVVVPAVKVVS
jgi:hypothetical protein